MSGEQRGGHDVAGDVIKLDKQDIPNGGHEPTNAELKAYLVKIFVAHNELLTETKAFANDSHKWRNETTDKLRQIGDTSTSTANRVSKATWMIAGAGAVFSVAMAAFGFILAAQQAGVTVQ